MKPGDKIEWLYEPRSGYGYRWWIPGVVVKVNPKRVRIEVKRNSGGTRQISVLPERLRAQK